MAVEGAERGSIAGLVFEHEGAAVVVALGAIACEHHPPGQHGADLGFWGQEHVQPDVHGPPSPGDMVGAAKALAAIDQSRLAPAAQTAHALIRDAIDHSVELSRIGLGSVRAQGDVIGGQVENRQAADIGIEHGVQPVKAGGQRREAGWQPGSGPEPLTGEARVQITNLRQQRQRWRLRNHHVGIVGESLLLQTGIGDTDRQPHQHQRPETVNLGSAQGRVPGIALDQRRHGLDGPDLAAGQIGPGDGQITDPGVE